LLSLGRVLNWTVDDIIRISADEKTARASKNPYNARCPPSLSFIKIELDCRAALTHVSENSSLPGRRACQGTTGWRIVDSVRNAKI